MLKRCLPILCVMPLWALAACASDTVTELRLLVQVAPGVGDAAGIAAQASRSSGTPVRYLGASGGGWHALGLSCRPGAQCDQAVDRLRADAARFPTVQRDERKHIISPLVAP